MSVIRRLSAIEAIITHRNSSSGHGRLVPCSAARISCSTYPAIVVSASCAAFLSSAISLFVSCGRTVHSCLSVLFIIGS